MVQASLWTPIMYAAHAGRKEAALALIEIGAAPCVAGLKVWVHHACGLVCVRVNVPV